MDGRLSTTVIKEATGLAKSNEALVCFLQSLTIQLNWKRKENPKVVPNLTGLYPLWLNHTVTCNARVSSLLMIVPTGSAPNRRCMASGLP